MTLEVPLDLQAAKRLVHCCTLSFCYLGAEMISAEIQMPITEII